MLPEREDHREFVTYDPETRTATCSECGILIDFSNGLERVGGNPLANHSFGYGLEINDIEVTQDDPRLDVFKDFLDG